MPKKAPSGPRRSRARPGQRPRSKTASARIDGKMLAPIDAIAAAREVTRTEAAPRSGRPLIARVKGSA